MIYEFRVCEKCDDYAVHYGIKLPAYCVRCHPIPRKRDRSINFAELKLRGVL